MEVTLKNVKFYSGMSEETNAFTADVYVDGKKCGYAKNEGCGGNTFVQPYPETRTKFFEVEGWLKGQPQINIGTENDPYMVDSDFEMKVDSLFEQWLKEKESKKLEKKMINCVMWGIPNGGSYSYVTFKRPLNQIPKPTLQTYLNQYKGRFKEGEKFLNTNLVGFEL